MRPKTLPSRPGYWLFLWTLAVSFGLWGCSNGRPIRNVVLISIDTLRADHVSSYGNVKETTPNIDGLAGEGVLVRNVLSPVPMTLPAHTTMLTGTLPPFHGMHDNLSYRLDDSQTTLAELLKAEGFATGAIVSSFVLDSRFNLDQGFDTYDDVFEDERKIAFLSERKGDETTEHALDWLSRHRQERFFLFVHYYDPHDGYDPPEPFRSRFSDDLYAGEVAFADHEVGRLVRKLDELELDDSTLVIVTGDHGEMLGEHEELTHGYFIYQSAVAVPWILRVPGQTEGVVVDTPASLADVVPTVVSLLGMEAPSRTQGVDLSPWFSDRPPAEAPQRAFYLESVTANRYYGASSLFGLVASGWKYIHTTRPELYDLEADPGETNNLLESQPRRAEAMKQRIEDLLQEGSSSAGGNRPELDQEARARLASLGYFGGSSPTIGDPLLDFAPEGKEDPKDLIGFYRGHQKLEELVSGGSFAEATRLAEELIAKRPSFVAGYFQLARIATDRGDLPRAIDHYRKALELAPDEARAHFNLANLLRRVGTMEQSIAHYRRALELDPDFDEARAGLGQALLEDGRFEEAAETLGEALAGKADSPQLLVELGRALAARGDNNGAIDRYRRAIAIDPRFAEAHLQLGMALGESGQTEEALGELRLAVELDPDNALAHNALGVTQKQLGRADEALASYRKALAIDPSFALAHNNLGSLLGARGQLSEAIRHFRSAVEAAPDYGEARNNLGLALRMTGDREEALTHFRAALATRQDWAVPMNEIAWVLATHPDPARRKPDEALRLARRAVELTQSRQPVFLDTLAAAQAATGDFDAAVETAERAIALASPRSPPLANEIRTRLELYRAKRAFREAVGTRAAPGR